MSSRKQQQNDKLVKAAKAVLARRDLAAFVDYVIKDQSGNPVKSAPHQIQWRDHLNYCWKINKASLILSPYSYAKSVWMAIALPLWLLGRNPNLRIIVISSAEKNAADRLQEIQRYITDSPEYREVFPWVQVDDTRQWNNQVANVKRIGKSASGFVSSVDQSISAFGYTAKAGNGVRAECVIFDDVVSDGNCDGEANRLTLKNSIERQWIPRSSKTPIYDKDGVMIAPSTIYAFIGTRYHTEDYYQGILDNPQSYCSLVQAVSEDFNYLDCAIIGAVEEVEHPVYTQYKNWEFDGN